MKLNPSFPDVNITTPPLLSLSSSPNILRLHPFPYFFQLPMGIAGAQHQCRTVDLEDLRRISERTPMHRKDSDDFYGRRVLSNSSSDTDEEPGDELVCVTSGVSLLGLALVNQLLQRGFSVRILLDNPGLFLLPLLFFFLCVFRTEIAAKIV